MQLIYVWPDGSWVFVDEVDDIDTYISACGVSDDFSIEEFSAEYL